MVRENKINILILLPTMFHLLFSAKSFNPDDLASVELFMFVGASLSPDQIRKLQRLGQGKVQTNYGLTEGHSTVTISTPGLDPEILSVTLGQSKSGETRVHERRGQTVRRGYAGRTSDKAGILHARISQSPRGYRGSLHSQMAG